MRQSVGFCTPFPLLFDYVVRRAGHKIHIVQLGVDFPDFRLCALKFLFKPRTLFCEVDHVSQRQSGNNLSHNELR